MATAANNIGALLHDTKYSDLEIQCEGKTFKVHRAIVCPRSRVLDRECSGGFSEAQTRVIEHRLFTWQTLEDMLQFIYKGDYNVSNPTTSLDEHRSKRQRINHEDQPLVITGLQRHVYVYAIADYYQLPDLKALALQKFRRFKSFLLPIAVDRLVDVIDAIYENTPSEDEDLRGDILTLCIDEKKTLLEDGHFAKIIAERSGLEEFTAEFMLGLSHRHHENLEEQEMTHRTIAETLQGDINTLKRKGNEHTKKCKTHCNQLKDANTKLDLAKKQIAQLKEFADWRKCPSCSRWWGFSLEPNGNGWLAKCNVCHAAHIGAQGVI